MTEYTSSPTKIEIYDTTLRDGAQSEGINFSVSDKLKIVKLLDDFGVSFIELGWFGANNVDNEVFQKINDIKLKNAKITCFGCTRKANINVKDDEVVKNLISANTSIVTIFGKTWDFHVTNALNTTLNENLNMIYDTIKFLCDKGKNVFFDCEHFFDGYKANSEYSLLCCKTALIAGAKRIILCDTNGGTQNNEIYNITKKVYEYLTNIAKKNKIDEFGIGIHAHNDNEMAVANSIAAIDGGACQIQGTINGYGERCGNANLCSIIPILQLKRGFDIVGENIQQLTNVANTVAEISNIPVNANMPFVGLSAFAHKAGVHASAVVKNSSTYEHIDPQTVGNNRKILISDQAGTASLKEKLKNLRLINPNDINFNDIPKIIDKIKTLEWEGYAFEGADASFELLVMDILKIKPKYFDILGFRMIGDTFNNNLNEINTEASIKLKIDENIIHTVSEGYGPVNSIDKAIRKALKDVYPQINSFKLSDFKVRILDSKSGTAAKVRVNIETTDGKTVWDTVGVNENIIVASFKAIMDSIIFGLCAYSNSKAKLNDMLQEGIN